MEFFFFGNTMLFIYYLIMNCLLQYGIENLWGKAELGNAIMQIAFIEFVKKGERERGDIFP